MSKINTEKLINTIVYFCKNTWENNLSETKILKLLFLCDFKHVEKYGRPISYETYYHLPHGPVPTLTKNFLDNLNKKHDYDLGRELDDFKDMFKTEERRTQKGNFNVIKLRVDTSFDDNCFSESELEVMNGICQKYYRTPARELKRITHMHRGYRETENNEIINYIYGIKNKNDRDYFKFWENEKAELQLICR